MHLSAVSDYASLSDSDLDNAYQAAWNTLQTATGVDKVTWSSTVNDIAQNILTRVGGLWGALTGAVGYNRFPLYNAIQVANPNAGGFQQSAVAQTAIANSAANVASNVTSAFKWTMGGLMGAGVAAIVLLYLIKKK